MSKVKNLVNALKTKKLSVWDLDPRIFEEVVFYGIMHFFLNNNIKGATYERCTKGEIDIIIRIPMLDHKYDGGYPEDTYFIECKYYKDKVSLDKSAKAFCAAIRYQPGLLLILSPIEISPLSKEYAEYFFGKNGIYKTRFKHCSLEELLNIKESEAKLSHPPVFQQRILKENLDTEISIRYWRFIEEKTFSHSDIASSDKSNPKIELDNRMNYSLKIWVKSFFNIKAKEVNLLSESENLLNEFELKRYEKLNSGGDLLLFKLNTNKIKCDFKPNFLQMVFKNITKKIAFNFPQLNVKKTEKIILEDFRENETQEFIKELSKQDSSNLIFLCGEGGIGKTYLCERIASGLSGINGCRAHLISTSEDTTEGIFYKLIWPVISPVREKIKDKLDDDEKEILAAVIEKEVEKLAGINPDEILHLIDNIMNLKLENVNIEALTFLCSGLLLRSSIPHVIVISNCHELSPGVIKGFKHLLMSLDDKDWGKIKFIFEYRDTKEDFNEEWEKFVSDMKTYIRGKIKQKRLTPLTKNQISRVLSKAFSGNDGGRLTESILTKTNGNPLFILQLLYHFLEKNYIEYIENIHFNAILNILDFAGIEKELEEIPEKVGEFLKRRVEFYLDIFISDTKFRNEIIFYLSIAALLGDEVDEYRILKAISWGSDKINKLRSFLIGEGFIQSHITSSSIKFVHQIMRLSILTVLKSNEEFKKAIMLLIGVLKPDVLEDAIIGGKAFFILKEFRNSFGWYNSAYEMAFGLNAYLQQRICLIGCKKNLDQISSMDEVLMRKRISILFQLGRVELQVGSQIDSLKIFDHLLEEITEIREDFLLNENELHENTMMIYKNKMTIHHRFLNPKSGLEVFLSAISELKTNEDIQDIVGRFVILCFESNFPEIAFKMIQIHRQIPFIENNYEQIASHLSNLGHTYLHTNPGITFHLWNRSVELAQSEREKNHAMLNSFVGDLYANSNFRSDDEINELESRVQFQGVENQMILLSLYKGVLCFNKNEFEEARHHFGIGLRKAQQKSIKFLEWECHNNIALFYLLNNQNHLALRYLEKASLIIKDTVTFYHEGHNAVTLASELVLKKFKHLNLPPNSSSFPIFNELPESIPAISGNHNALLFNLFQLSDTKEFSQLIKFFRSSFNGNSVITSEYFKDFYLCNSGENPLLVKIQNKKLILAL